MMKEMRTDKNQGLLTGINSYNIDLPENLVRAPESGPDMALAPILRNNACSTYKNKEGMPSGTPSSYKI
jgi:hypothetical protein